VSITEQRQDELIEGKGRTTKQLALLGNLGGFLGPFLVGYFITRTGSNLTGIVILSISLVLAGLMTLVFRYGSSYHQPVEETAPEREKVAQH